ncbi:MAG: hypothetical protein R3208_18105, partial [Ketobacteraceae bacterium]|nr:hypothetical protein [Ketobacteraceae bacterium]
VVQPLEAVINRHQPEIIYTHHNGDLNIDHRITHQAVLTACRPQPGSSVKAIYSFEVLSSTEWNTPGSNPFLPSYHVDITTHLDTKRQALEAYALEMLHPPHSRSIDHALALAHHRGHSVGFEAAEAFMVIRILQS